MEKNQKVFTLEDRTKYYKLAVGFKHNHQDVIFQIPVSSVWVWSHDRCHNSLDACWSSSGGSEVGGGGAGGIKVKSMTRAKCL